MAAIKIHLLLIPLVFFTLGLIFCTIWRNNVKLEKLYVRPELNSVDTLERIRHIDANVLLDKLTDLLAENSDFPTNVNSIQQENPLLHKYVYFRHLTPPSKQPYNLPGHHGSHYMNTYVIEIQKLFNNKKNGVFIEAGAYDGVSASNTIYLEKTLGWSGLLVECNPFSVPFLKLKNRKAWIADVCLSQTQYPATVNFSNPTKWTPSAKIGDPADLSKWGINTDWTQFQVMSIPLFALLSAINMTDVDLFSLDVEGAEFDVLKTIPWEKVNIKSIFVEVNQFSSEVQGEIQAFLESKGYILFDDYGSDHLYIQSSFMQSLTLRQQISI